MCCRLNLLIAIMGDSYEKVKESEHVEAIRERARIIVEEEKRFPKSHRYHRFMHFVRQLSGADVLEAVLFNVHLFIRSVCHRPVG